uniref:Uncharacterized protein n=1 Tax=Oryza nivara TaxID=4536 RepID=A0A0E0IBW1_ORYNI
MSTSVMTSNRHYSLSANRSIPSTACTTSLPAAPATPVPHRNHASFPSAASDPNPSRTALAAPQPHCVVSRRARAVRRIAPDPRPRPRRPFRAASCQGPRHAKPHL